MDTRDSGRGVRVCRRMIMIECCLLSLFFRSPHKSSRRAQHRQKQSASKASRYAPTAARSSHLIHSIELTRIVMDWRGYGGVVYSMNNRRRGPEDGRRRTRTETDIHAHIHTYIHTSGRMAVSSGIRRIPSACFLPRPPAMMMIVSDGVCDAAVVVACV